VSSLNVPNRVRKAKPGNPHEIWVCRGYFDSMFHREGGQLRISD